uniref:Pentatricopeptide repeat-containing protein n=1 Tax=Ananas comosus var. bracteatus TaxID=296719 RepID=A0A6V7NPV2_ANACO|nr:unnamed protein product [Ananas comosus var. bracteatus]
MLSNDSPRDPNPPASFPTPSPLPPSSSPTPPPSPSSSPPSPAAASPPSPSAPSPSPTASPPLDSYALSAAISSSKSPPHAAQIHACAAKSGWASSVFVGGALVDLYVRLGSVRHARQMFDEIPLKNTVCANALLAGYVESRSWDESLSFVGQMNELGLEADGFTLSSVLRICAELAAVNLGAQAHAYLIRKVENAEEDAFLFSALVEMYGKCGLVGKARLIFESARKEVRRRDVVLWTSMLNAYGRNGRFDDVIRAFEEMLVEGIEPDEIALLVVLSACARSGQVLKGLSLFESMRKGYGMVPGPEHYGCVVDMLCKAGELGKAWDFANEMVLDKGGDGGGVTVWVSLLSACREFGNVEIGRSLLRRLSNWNLIMWIEELRVLMKGKGLEKDLAFSRLEHVK